MPIIRLRTVPEVPHGAVLRTMETTALLEGNGSMNYACGGGCHRILMRHMNDGTLFAFFGDSRIKTILRCPDCGTLNLVSRNGPGKSRR